MLAGRRAHLLLLALAATGLLALAFVTHARNRLLSGRPVRLPDAAVLAGSVPCALAAVGVLLLAVPLVRPSRAAWGLALAGGAMAAAGLAWMAGAAATALAQNGSASARTSLGAGVWLALLCVLLAGGEAVRGLRLRSLAASGAGLALLAPLALLIAFGALSDLSILREYAAQRVMFADLLLRHVWLVMGALLPTLLIGIPLGVAAWGRAGVRRAAFPVLNIVQTIPSIALFGLLMAPLAGLAAVVPLLGRLGVGGVGPAPAVIALVLYSLLPVVRSTVAGLEGVPEPVRDAARGMGMTPRAIFWRVDVPLALPVLIAGLRVTAVQAVGLAAVAALIGAGGLGAIMFQGLFANAQDLVLLGAVPVILLALAVDFAFRILAALGARHD